MLALKNKVTNLLLKSERKSLVRFLTLYTTMSILMIVIVAMLYYQTQEKLMLAERRAVLSNYAYIQTKKLKVLHHFFPKRVEYPRNKKFKSAIYDLEYMKIFSLIKEKSIYLEKDIYIINNHVHYIKLLDDFYLGAKYLIIEVEESGEWRVEIIDNIIYYGLSAFLLFIIFGLYLSKLFLKPMRDSIVLLDRFIKDTTHELNTPLSAILANIEMMDIDIMAEKNRVKLNRINIAAKTVSILYKDLTYLLLEQDKRNSDELINIKELILDRVEYFSILMKSKRLKSILDLQDSEIFIDRRKLTRVIDNIISNAIKYNIRNGEVGIILREKQLTIWDKGIGIDIDKTAFIFERYMRFNSSEGGFGIGLSIVKKIIDEYNIDIKVESELNKGTRMVLTW